MPNGIGINRDYFDTTAPNLPTYGGISGNIGGFEGMEEFIARLFSLIEKYGISFPGGPKDKNFLNLVPAFLGAGMQLLNQPSMPKFKSPAEIGRPFDIAKARTLAEIDVESGQRIGDLSREAYSSGLGPLAIANLTQRVKTSTQRAKGDIASKFNEAKLRAINDYETMIKQLEMAFEANKKGGINQILGNIGSLATLFLLG